MGATAAVLGAAGVLLSILNRRRYRAERAAIENAHDRALLAELARYGRG